MIIYPDLETTLVTYFKDNLDSSVYVSVKNAPADMEQPVAQVILTVSPSSQKTPVTRYANVMVEVFALSFQAANELGYFVEALLREAISTSQIKSVQILVGPVRQAEESVYEKRSISAEVVMKAASI